MNMERVLFILSNGMVSIVLQLQQDIQDSTKKVTDLLRRAKVIAVKLNLVDFWQWIESELNGYKLNSHIPEYRVIQWQPKAYNSYYGERSPITFRDSNDRDAFAHRAIGQSIAELDHIVQNRDDEKWLQIPYPEDIQIQMREFLNWGATQFTLLVTYTAVRGIIESVRDILLDWSLKLEKEWILWGEITFSEEEKQLAQWGTINHYTITNFGNFAWTVGAINDQATVIVNTQFNENELWEINKILIQLTDAIKILSLWEEKEFLLAQEIKSVQSLVREQPKETWWIQKWLSAVKRMLEGAWWDIIAQGFIIALKSFL